ncbi:MAG: Transcriptional regulator, AcrR family [uncultured Rubrobacteraceae bacterium]|uniref:Transcriptional regulator, AcrR family n=1 Tax=uncultured Rubrobacteraceae bacterium TaxID=349277 RepID=A0A6J4S0K2_9ACTN|nr:MAG: Transcriptional regulator, AcrR family [uncultured Rubrobacteraceae bacterium]
MDAAESRLAEVGYLGVSLEEVAREVGVSKPALYYHFPGGKEQLFVEIAHRALRQHREGLERAMSSAGPTGEGKLRAAARWLMADRDPKQPMGEIRDVAKFVQDRHRAELAEGFASSLYGPIRSVISSAIEAGEFGPNDPDFLAWSFLGLCSGLLEVERTPPNSPIPRIFPQHGPDLPNRMVDLFLGGARA